jgi:PAS domain S-box-containing protein
VSPANSDDWSQQRDKIVGLGAESSRKHYYVELQRRVNELERFKTLLNHSGEIILMVQSATENIVDANQAACAALGHTYSEMLNLPLCALLDCITCRELRDAAATTPKRAGMRLLRCEFTTKDGSRIPIEIDANQVEFDTISYLVIVGRDIRERAAWERALQESERNLRTLFNSTYDGLVLNNYEGRILAMNDKALDMYGIRREEVDHYHVEDLSANDEDQIARLPGILSRSHTSDEMMFEWRARRPGDGSVFDVEVGLRRIQWYDQPAVIAMVRDITHRKRADQERFQFEERMRATQKLESLGVLAGGIAHDFNNLLTAMLGNASMLLMNMPAEPRMLRCVQDIELAAHRAAELCQQMLAYAGQGHRVLQLLDLNQLVREMMQILCVSISKKVHVEFEFAEGLPPVKADAAQLRQVVMNLITNASEAISDRVGLIRLHTDRITCGADFFTPAWQLGAEPGDYVSLRISDDGNGMDASTLARIFEPFFTTKFSGRGLGLAAVLGIVRSHHGAIRIESVPDRGTEFLILLPTQQGRITVPLPALDPARSTNQVGKGTVLVVDDEPIVCDAARRMLEFEGYTVLIATNGAEALETFVAHAKGILCVLLDLKMPIFDGMETLTELSRLHPECRVIISSGYTDHPQISTFSNPCLRGFLEKPYTRTQLLAKIKQAIAKS